MRIYVYSTQLYTGIQKNNTLLTWQLSPKVYLILKKNLHKFNFTVKGIFKLILKLIALRKAKKRVE